jgi:hypothetical protein
MAQNQKPKQRDPMLEAVEKEGLFGKKLPDAREFNNMKPEPDRLPKVYPVTEEQGKLNSELMWAARYGYLIIAKQLIDNGADVNATFTGGITVLSTAEQYGNTETADLLRKCGAK